ncbi:MAG: SDR family NAD(P)-dependent oxidoreductase [Alphaproteobacteria bacterium]
MPAETIAPRRTALITGSGQNIGRAVALALAADGFNIVVNGLNKRVPCEETAAAARGHGVEAVVAMGDAGTAEGCAEIAGTGISRFGSIDVLVHNAAIRPLSPFLEMDEAEWHRVLDVNLGGAFWLARACLPGMVKAGWGRVVTFAGMNAIQGYTGRAHVSVSKHAGWGLTKALAKEFGPQGITVNCISPGPIRSDHDDPAMTAHIKGQVSRIPTGRLGEPDEVAAAVSLLASDKGAFINGQMIQVNGGIQT